MKGVSTFYLFLHFCWIKVVLKRYRFNKKHRVCLKKSSFFSFVSFLTHVWDSQSAGRFFKRTLNISPHKITPTNSTWTTPETVDSKNILSVSRAAKAQTVQITNSVVSRFTDLNTVLPADRSSSSEDSEWGREMILCTSHLILYVMAAVVSRSWVRLSPWAWTVKVPPLRGSASNSIWRAFRPTTVFFFTIMVLFCKAILLWHYW